MAVHPFRPDALKLILRNAQSRLLAATPPARDATLGLGGALLDLLVKLVNSLQGIGFGIFGEGLGVALGYGSLFVGLGDLVERGVSKC